MPEWTCYTEVMGMHEERYVLAIEAGHTRVSLRDQRTGESHTFDGPRALYDALGVLADWRDRDLGVGNGRDPIAGCERDLAPDGADISAAVRRAYENGQRDERALRDMGF